MPGKKPRYIQAAIKTAISQEFSYLPDLSKTLNPRLDRGVLVIEDLQGNPKTDEIPMKGSTYLSKPVCGISEYRAKVFGLEHGSTQKFSVLS